MEQDDWTPLCLKCGFYSAVNIVIQTSLDCLLVVHPALNLTDNKETNSSGMIKPTIERILFEFWIRQAVLSCLSISLLIKMLDLCELHVFNNQSEPLMWRCECVCAFVCVCFTRPCFRPEQQKGKKKVSQSSGKPLIFSFSPSLIQLFLCGVHGTTGDSPSIVTQHKKTQVTVQLGECQ